MARTSSTDPVRFAIANASLAGEGWTKSLSPSPSDRRPSGGFFAAKFLEFFFVRAFGVCGGSVGVSCVLKIVAKFGRGRGVVEDGRSWGSTNG
jgi:hypothetical protein